MKIFRQMRQNFARVVGATRRNFVKYDGKDAADSSASEFLEVPYIYYYSETQNAAFCIMQNSIADTNAFIDNEGIEIVQLEIKGNKAVLIENDTDEIIYTLIWKQSSVVVQICPKCLCIYGFVNKF